MKEYIFRGKKISDNRWIEGSLIQWPAGEAQIVVPGREYGKMVAHGVVPESVGIYIGIKGYTGEYETRRENEVKLFDGDIVEARSEGSRGIFIIRYSQQSSPGFFLYPAWQSRKMWSIHGSDIGRSPGDYLDNLCVLGNIHDNPELVKQMKA
ncbi:MAG: YopX family protein [Pseudobacter sp.]|uniref:YopX family protein n=1 Tax=Pseudobacter sp. TaxID=2045420 RepID=UPI003F7D752A